MKCDTSDPDYPKVGNAFFLQFVRNGEKCKMHKIEWCEGGLQMADIGTKNISEPDLTPRMKYIMVRLET